MNFEKFLDHLDLSHIVIATETGSYGRAAIEAGQSLEPVDLPSRVAVSFTSNVDLLKSLKGLDGCVDAIVLLPPSAPTSVCLSLIDKADVGLVFTDRTDLQGMQTVSTAPGKFSGVPGIETSWLMATSGTTNEPKLVAHSLKSLTRTVNHTLSGDKFVWGQLYDCYRFAGMQVLLQAMAAGNKLVAPQMSMPLADKISLFAEEGVNAISATPTMWRKILMQEENQQLQLKSITLGGEISDQPVLTALAKAYPAARIRHIYASTEAGTGFVVADGLAGFPAEYLENGYGDIGIKIIHNILHIENPLVAGSYVGSGETFSGRDSYVNTGDLVKIEGDRVFFLGRASGIINVGGDKVYPETVENILNSVDGVSLSKVYGKKSPVTGELVMADVVVKDGFAPSDVKMSLMKTSKAVLEPYQRPVGYKFVDQIAISENGKVMR